MVNVENCNFLKVNCRFLLVIWVKWKQSVSSITLLYSSTFCSLFLTFFVLEIFKFKDDTFLVRNSAAISKFDWFEQPCSISMPCSKYQCFARHVLLGISNYTQSWGHLNGVENSRWEMRLSMPYSECPTPYIIRVLRLFRVGHATIQSYPKWDIATWRVPYSKYQHYHIQSPVSYKILLRLEQW